MGDGEQGILDKLKILNYESDFAGQTALEAAQGKISSQSPTDATSSK